MKEILCPVSVRPDSVCLDLVRINWVTQAVRRGLNLFFGFDFYRWRHYYRILCKSNDSKWRQFRSILVSTYAEELQIQDFGLNFQIN